MFLNHQNFFRTTILAVACVVVLPITVFAEGLDLEGLPPQPAQSTLPEEGVNEAPLNIGAPARVEAEHKKMAPAPTATLDKLEPEPPAPVVSEEPYSPPEPTPVPYSGTYYDSDSIGPGPLGASAGPRKVDPKYEPGSSFVVVKKNASSSSRQANIVAAQRALKLQRYSAALELYEKLYKKNPRNKQILMGLAVSQQHNGFTESAIATYEEILKISPRHTGAMVNLMGLLEQRQPAVALRKLQKLWNKNGQNPVVAAQLGLVSAKMQDYEGASRYLGIAASLEPANPLHYYNLAIVLDQSQSYKSAIEYYQKALEIDAANSGGGSISRDQVYDRLAQLRRL